MSVFQVGDSVRVLASCDDPHLVGWTGEVWAINERGVWPIHVRLDKCLARELGRPNINNMERFPPDDLEVVEGQ